ncbi:MAG: hypothetical protein ACJ75B_01360 [Flavisolibacter sp.]
MKKNLTALLIATLLSLPSLAGDSTESNHAKPVLNFFIISKPKKGKPDLASRFNILRTGVRAFFHSNHFVSIVASSSEDMSKKVLRKIKRKNACIGTLWFDSHGVYKKAHSLFMVGRDEFNYLNIGDEKNIKYLQLLQPYCSDETNIVIGSCYGGATFKRGFAHNNDSIRMNGDSLMMGLGRALKSGNVFASESWVMTKPGLFYGKSSVAGFPMRKLFRDVVYRPAWEHVGVWNVYSGRLDHVMAIPPVTLDGNGSLHVRNKTYISERKVRRKIHRKMQRLEPDLAKT